MANPAAVDVNSRQIRVFLSSTFRDFMEERDLLVKQVFPRLRKQAQDRGVELVDVDLRWGVTQEESEQGKVIGICLAEIDNCRPYFIGMLGERYGWIPPEDKYPPVVLEQQAWLQQHVGGASVTELEILHGVLNDPKMAGRAFFYFRDPAWSQAQSEPGFVCDTPEEEAKLATLKERILASNFPVKQGLPDPKAIADQIEADLWSLIEEQYPDLDQADALEREARKHASYRQSRLGVYLGQEYVDQLEALIGAGEHKILITGESGSGKSALIANWMHQREREHPGDVVYAHHLGCSNDANAIRPLLGRMLNTASKLLKEAELITEQIQVPEDWWKLTAKVAETLQDLGRWCRKTGHRWIWVVDGLDRLAKKEQQALPWLPLLIPQGVSLVISALDCQAKTILQEQQFQLLEIGPLQRIEQEQLIETYLERYTKKLEADRLQQILACDLARSPLFLRVLLEELRQCGRFETLEAQIAEYIRPNADGSLAVNDLYARVLERLESDCGTEPVRKALTALWASRAGLSEPELLAITGLALLQWAPIDLSLEKALGRNGNRLIFDHDYLLQAVEDRYLYTQELKCQGHSQLADWFSSKKGWHNRKAEELPWQLQEAGRHNDLREWLLKPWELANLQRERGSQEAINYWLAAKAEGDGELDELIAQAVDEEIEKRKESVEDQICFIHPIATLLDEAGLYRTLLLRLRTLALELEEAKEGSDEESVLTSLAWLANAYQDMGHYDEAEPMLLSCLEALERLLGHEHPYTLSSINNLGLLYKAKGDYKQAEAYYSRCLEARERLLGPEHPATLSTIGNLGLLYLDNGDYEQAEDYCKRDLDACERLLGREHPSTLTTVGNLGLLYKAKGDYEQAEAYYSRCLEARKRLLGAEHPATLSTVHNLAVLYQTKGDYGQAEDYYIRCLDARERLLGREHPDTLNSVNNLGMLYKAKGDYEQAEAYYSRCLEARERLLGPEHPATHSTVSNLGLLYFDKGDYKQAETCYCRCLEALERLLGPEHPDTLTIVNNLGLLFKAKGDYEQAETYYSRCLEALERLLGPEHPDTLAIVGNLAGLYQAKGDYEQAEAYYSRCLEAIERLLGPEHIDTVTTIGNLANLYQAKGDYEQAEAYYSRCLEALERLLGREHPSTLTTVGNLAGLYQDKGDYEQAEAYYKRDLEASERLLGPEHPSTLTTVGNLAVLYHAKGDYEQAEVHCSRCLNAREEMLGREHPDTLTTVNNLAVLYQAKGDYEQAEAYYSRCLDAFERLLGPEHPATLTTVGNLAGLHHAKGDYVQAEACYISCLQARDQLLGRYHPDTLSTAYSLAEMLSLQERRAEAIPLRRRELAWCREQNGATDPSTLTSINGLAIDLRETGSLDEAEALFRELLATRQQMLQPSDFGIGTALGGLAITLERAGKLGEAAAFAQQALDHRLEHEGPDAWWTNQERLDLARVLHKLGQSADARQLLDTLQTSLAGIAEPDDHDRQLLADAAALRAQIEGAP